MTILKEKLENKINQILKKLKKFLYGTSEVLSEKMSKKPFERKKKVSFGRDDLDFAAECKSVEHSRKSPLTNIIYLTILLLGIFVVWSYFANIDQVTVAEGEVVPSSRIQTIQ